jgi:hypothetical protein
VNFLKPDGTPVNFNSGGGPSLCGGDGGGGSGGRVTGAGAIAQARRACPQWALAIGCWEYPERSLVKAAAVVRELAGELAGARARVERIAEVLETNKNILARTARMNKRKKHPNIAPTLQQRRLAVVHAEIDM